MHKLIMDKINAKFICFQMVDYKVDYCLCNHDRKKVSVCTERYECKYAPRERMNSKRYYPIVLVNFLRGIIFPPLLLLKRGKNPLKVEVSYDMQKNAYHKNRTYRNVHIEQMHIIYPFRTASGVSFTIGFTKSDSFAITSSMSLYAPGASERSN